MAKEKNEKSNRPAMDAEKAKKKKKLDICYFKVPLIFIHDLNDAGELVIRAAFKEVDMTNRCFKIETVETEDADGSIKIARGIAEDNNKTLLYSSKAKNVGDIVTRITMTDHGKVTVNPEL